ncbi:MAG: hypothetical protein IJ302_08570 [Clostridia bacterium]|nr:hypothetical protein [Clostridia bacterium]
MISPRQFFEFVLVYISFFGIMLLAVFTIGRGSTMAAGQLSRSELYVMEIESLIPRPYYSLLPKGDYDSFSSLISSGTPNLVVRVTFEERQDATVYDPYGYYTDETLESTLSGVKTLLDRNKKHNGETEPVDTSVYGWKNDAAYAKAEAIALYISTPYEAKVEEVLLGNCLQVGDSFTFYAPYGIIGDFYARYEDCPIFSEGREYILFFSVVDVTDVGRWYDLVHPAAAVEILQEDNRTFASIARAGDAMFYETEYDCETLTELLTAQYTENPYPLTIPEISPVAP